MIFRRRKDSSPKPAAPPTPATGAEADPELAPDGSLFLTGDSRLDQKSVDVLLEAIAEVSASRDLESLLVHIVDMSIETTQAERGFLIMHLEGREGDEALEVRVERNRARRDLSGASDVERRFSTTIVRQVLERHEPLRATVQSDSEAMELSMSVFDLKLQAVMCVPIGRRGVTSIGRGVLYVDSKAATREFKPRDLALFAALSQHIGIALENAELHLASLEKVRLERSLEIASEIQAGLMPPVPAIPGYDLYGWFRPAEETSGDFFDFVRGRDQSWNVVVGDVTGHGLGPALVTATAQASLRSYLRVVDEPSKVLQLLNQDLCERLDDDMFLTLFLARFEADGVLWAVNAGHTPPLIWRAATGEVEVVTGHGPALGMLDSFDFEEGMRLALEPGDALVVFTDGLVEARPKVGNRELFGEERLIESLKLAAPKSSGAQELAERLVERVLEYAHGFREDDMTLVTAVRCP